MKLNLKKITRTFGLTLLLGLSNIGYAATTYSGKHDSASCTRITGWAWDSTQPTTPITVDIYDGSNKLTTLTADVFRQSLLDGGKGDGKHSFTFPTPASLRDGVAHSITIMIGGTQQKLTSSPKSITCGALYNIQSDHLGTPRVVVDQNNKVVWRNEGEPFGNGLPEQDVDADGKPFTLNLRFPGQYYDKETGRNQNFFRDYNPETGRYVQSDPIGLTGGVNTFGYVEGNPVGVIDPEGLAGRYSVDCGRCKLIYDSDNQKGPHTHWVCPGQPKGCIKKDGSLCDGSAPPPPEVKQCLKERGRILANAKMCQVAGAPGPNPHYADGDNDDLEMALAKGVATVGTGGVATILAPEISIPALILNRLAQ